MTDFKKMDKKESCTQKAREGRYESKNDKGKRTFRKSQKGGFLTKVRQRKRKEFKRNKTN